MTNRSESKTAYHFRENLKYNKQDISNTDKNVEKRNYLRARALLFQIKKKINYIFSVFITHKIPEALQT